MTIADVQVNSTSKEASEALHLTQYATQAIVAMEPATLPSQVFLGLILGANG